MKFKENKNPNKKINVSVETVGSTRKVDLKDINTELLNNDATYTRVKYDVVVIDGATFEVKKLLKNKNVFDHFIHSIETLEFNGVTKQFKFTSKKGEYEFDTVNNKLRLNGRVKSTNRKCRNEEHEGFNYDAYGKQNNILLYRLAAILHEIVDKGVIRTTYNNVVVNHTRNDSSTESQNSLDLNTLEITNGSRNTKHGRIWNYINRNSAFRMKTDFLSTNEEFMEYIESFIENGDMISEQDLLNVGAVLDARGCYVIR